MSDEVVKIAEIARLAVIISQNTNDDVFVNYVGHVNKLEVEYFQNGWGKENKATKRISFYLDQEDADKKVDKAFNLLLDKVKEYKIMIKLEDKYE